MRFKIAWASLIVGSKFTGFALVLLCILRKFSKYKTPGAYIWRGYLTEGFFALLVWGGLYLEGFIFGILRYSTKAASVNRLKRGRANLKGLLEDPNERLLYMNIRRISAY